MRCSTCPIVEKEDKRSVFENTTEYPPLLEDQIREAEVVILENYWSFSRYTFRTEGNSYFTLP